MLFILGWSMWFYGFFGIVFRMISVVVGILVGEGVEE